MARVDNGSSLGASPKPRTIDTADVLRALPYHSELKGWHSHGGPLIPTDGCAACSELRRRQKQNRPAPRKGTGRNAGAEGTS